jgi:uncharacterized membrane protein YidH (DUF202 family)
MKTERIRDGFRPWAGLALGTTGFFLAHQIGSDATFQDCRVASPLIVIVGTLIGLLVIGLGTLGSWRVYAAEGETPARTLIAVVGMLACALYVIGVLLPFVAALVIPGCWA